MPTATSVARHPDRGRPGRRSGRLGTAHRRNRGGSATPPPRPRSHPPGRSIHAKLDDAAGRDIAAGIVDHVASQAPALLVPGSTGRHLWTRPSDRHLARNVLAHTDQATLIVGPHADPHFQPNPGTLVVCVNTSDPYPTTIEAVDRWRRTFASDPPWIVEVVATIDDQADHGDRDVHRWATALESLQVPATTRVLHGGDPVEWLDDSPHDCPTPPSSRPVAATATHVDTCTV